MRYLLSICFFVYMVAVHADPGQARDAKAPAGITAGVSERSTTRVDAVKRLSLSELIQQVVTQNQQIQIQKAQ